MRLGIPGLAVLLLNADAFIVKAQVNQWSCTTGSHAPVLRSTGVSELAGDVFLTCTGGNAAVTRDIPLTLNTEVTSRVTPGPEAVLVIDEPETPVPGVNLIQAEAAGNNPNEIRFRNVPLSGSGTRNIRISNIRVDATAVPKSTVGDVPQVIVLVSASGLSINNPQFTAGYVHAGLAWDTAVPRAGLPAGTCNGHNQALVSNTAASGGRSRLFRSVSGGWSGDVPGEGRAGYTPRRAQLSGF